MASQRLKTFHNNRLIMRDKECLYINRKREGAFYSTFITDIMTILESVVCLVYLILGLGFRLNDYVPINYIVA